MATSGTTYFGSAAQQSLVNMLKAIKDVLSAQYAVTGGTEFATAIIAIDTTITTACEKEKNNKTWKFI